MTNFPAQFSDIYGAVIDKVRLDVTADTGRVKAWVNQSYYQACLETNFYESADQQTSALAAGATNVTVPTLLVKIEFINAAGADGTLWGPMDEITFEEILELRAWAGGTLTTGAPSRYAFRSSATPSIEFWPNAAGGEKLNFYGLQLPTALSADADVPIFPEPYASKVLEYGALVQAAEFKKDLLMVQTYQEGYSDWIQRLRGFNTNRAGAKAQQFRVEGQRPFPSGNSVDQGA